VATSTHVFPLHKPYHKVWLHWMVGSLGENVKSWAGESRNSEKVVLLSTLLEAHK
jgi:hypothetical protein